MQDRAERIAWFKATILPHEAALRRYLGRLLRRPGEIDDFVAEALTATYSSDRWREVLHGRPYLFRIARNLVYDALRRQQVVAFAAMADLDLLHLADNQPSAEAVVSARDELRGLMAALDELPPRARQVFLLRRVEGLSVREIGDRLGLSVKTVENHMTRAIALFTSSISQRDTVSELSSASAWRVRQRR